MPQVLHKRSTASGGAPTTSDLPTGAIGLNTFEGKVFIKRDPGTPEIVVVGRPMTISSSAPSGGQDGDIWFQYTP